MFCELMILFFETGTQGALLEGPGGGRCSEGAYQEVEAGRLMQGS